MDEKFFLDKMADLMGVCVCQYDCRTKEKQSFGKEGGIQRLPFQDAEILEENLQLGEVEFPMIRMSRSNREILFVQIRDPKEKNAWYSRNQVFRSETAELMIWCPVCCFCTGILREM